MFWCWSRLVLTVVFLELGASIQSLKFKELRKQYYTDIWVVQTTVKHLLQEHSIENIAEKHGLTVFGKVEPLAGYYRLRLVDTSLHKRALEVFSGRLDHITQALQREQDVGYAAQQMSKTQYHKSYSYPSDPLFPQQWSLVNSGQSGGPQGLDINVEPVWLQGLTGEGIVVAVVDDGLEVKHPDITSNYDPAASWDFVSEDNDPSPSLTSDEPDRHGTECAGEIAMAKDNNQCGVGVAYECNIGGLKFSLSDSSDATESRALGFKNDYIQVYSNSWGPADYGFVVGGPEPLTEMALENAVTKGRDRKGSILVWAAGNGGKYNDSCAADGYTSSIYTIGIGSADQTGRAADYDELCSAKIATTFSYNSATFPSDGTAYNQITTTSLNGQCVEDFTGTSASAPMVSGVIALLLQANSNLTWRDVQYLLVYTSDRSKLQEGDWSMNGAGLSVSHKFGFGAINAEALITRGRHWSNVPEQLKTVVPSNPSSGIAHPGSTTTLNFELTQGNIPIQFVEHVVFTATLTINRQGSRLYGFDDYFAFLETLPTEEAIIAWLQDPHPRRGDISIKLLSPQGTTSILLPQRTLDFINEDGYQNWPFMSVHYWGENPEGLWTLSVDYTSPSGSVSISNPQLTIYGTAVVPESAIPRKCSEACAGGCFGNSSSQCDTCKEFRVLPSLECVTQCPNGTFPYNQYCTAERIVIPARVNIIGIAIGVSSVSLLLVVAVFLGVCCACKYQLRKKKAERAVRYRRLQSSQPTSVAV